MELMPFLIIAAVFLILTCVRQVNQHERGVKFTFGRVSGVMGPGLHLLIPIAQTFKKIDIRTKVIDVPKQEAITKDNVSIGINAVVYYKISDAKAAMLEVENVHYAVSQLAQTTMRNIVGTVTLDELLTNRDKISTEIQSIVDKATDPWGVKVDNVELKDVALPEEMKRVLARGAEAEREKLAVITKSEGEVQAAHNLSEAAKLLGSTQGALHLRTLETINDVSSDQSNTIIFALPVEVLDAFKSLGKK